jgi:spore coat polysaccharide biosynthesis protein SpsF
MRAVAIIQARMGSTRLPGKVLENLAGQPMLARVANRTMRAKTISDIVVATTETPMDNVIATLCREYSWQLYRGSEQDLLDRYYRAALAFGADAIVRITSDCPLIDPKIIDKVITEFLTYHVDYASNSLIRTFPRGLDTEVMTFTALQRAWQEDKNPVWREHVTPYLYKHPELFTLHNVSNKVDYSYMRWTVDTPDDLVFVRKIYQHFKSDEFTWEEVLQLLTIHSEWLETNRHVSQKEIDAPNKSE